jgi:hypothetical protein
MSTFGVHIFLAASLTACIAVAACTRAEDERPAPTKAQSAKDIHLQATDSYGRTIKRVCPPNALGSESCTLYELGPTPDGVAIPGDTPAPGVTGWGATELASAYDIPTTLPTSATIGIISGSYNPTMETDLQVYRQRYSLPSCTIANGCLRIVNSSGGTDFPGGSYDADLPESSVDVQMASAGCPNCKLLVVVASPTYAQSPSVAEIAAAAQEAETLGASVLTVSYIQGSATYGATLADGGDAESAYAMLSIPMFAASGDNGYRSSAGDTGLPSSYRELISVGAVSLTEVAPSVSVRRWTESVWNNSLGATQSGCAIDIAKPSWQVDTGCAGRTVVDLSAAGDQILFYYTDLDGDPGAWVVGSGTSAASPLAAGIFAATGQVVGLTPQFPYAAQTDFHDVTTGNNGTCAIAYLCTAVSGYDAPTGIGTPDGYALQGHWLSTDSPNAAVNQGSQTYLTIDTNDYWAQDYTKLSFSVTGLPTGVTASYSAITPNAGNPYISLTLSASLSAPITTIGQRATVTATYQGTSGAIVHTMSFFLDVGPCQSTASCSINGVQIFCGAIPNGCGGTLSCPTTCGYPYTCVSGECTNVTRNPPPGECPCGGVEPHCHDCYGVPVADGGPPIE